MAATRKPVAERFWSKVHKTETCWLWTGWRNPNGYGRIWLGDVGRREAFAHRVAYELLVGAIPEELQLDHLCRVKHCVNPAHLEAVSAQVNVLRSTNAAAVNAAKTHCDHGHPFNEINTYIDTRGWRGCRPCRREAMRRRRARKAAVSA